MATLFIRAFTLFIKNYCRKYNTNTVIKIMISDELILELQEIIKRKYGTDLSFKGASHPARGMQTRTSDKQKFT